MISADDIKAGKSYCLFFKEGNPNNCVLQVRAIVDERQYVTRTWSTRRGWIYTVHPWEYFDALSDCLTEEA